MRPRSEQNIFLNACDIGITAIITGLTGVSVPSRSYNIFAAGKPILAIADPGGEVSQLITEYNLGWVVNPGDTDAFASAITGAYNNPSKLDNIRKKSRKLIEERYSREHVINQYVTCIDKCSKNTRPSSTRKNFCHNFICLF